MEVKVFLLLVVILCGQALKLQGITRNGLARLVPLKDGEGDVEIKHEKTSISDALKNAVKGKSWLKSRAIGVGSCAGDGAMSNTAFEDLVNTSDTWISKRTGIRSRHIIQAGNLRDIAVKSAKKALENAGVNAADIDLVIVATSSPDDLFGDAPSVAAAVGAKNAAAFDLTAACSGFLFGVVTASQFLEAGAYRRVLVIGADALTRFVDWSDRSTCILFGDGSGAVVLEAAESKEEAGILGFALHSDGEGYSKLRLPFKSRFENLNNGAQTVVEKGEYGKMSMDGAEVYKFAVNRVPEVIQEALNNAGLKPTDIDWLLLHQANIRIMEHAADVLGIPMTRVLRNIEECGNTSAGSIPLALAEAMAAGKIKKGDIIATAGFGAGLSWGSAIIRWG